MGVLLSVACLCVFSKPQQRGGRGPTWAVTSRGGGGRERENEDVSSIGAYDGRISSWFHQMFGVLS
jgi:hypothetical protein